MTGLERREGRILNCGACELKDRESGTAGLLSMHTRCMTWNCVWMSTCISSTFKSEWTYPSSPWKLSTRAERIFDGEGKASIS